MSVDSRPRRRRPLALAISLALAASGAHAATISVTSDQDDNGSSCTLRQAIVSMQSQALQGGCSFADGAAFRESGRGSR